MVLDGLGAEEALGGRPRCHPDADEIGYVLFCRAEVWPPVAGIVPSGDANGDGELEARGDPELVRTYGQGGFRRSWRLSTTPLGLGDVAGGGGGVPAAFPEIAQSEEKVSDGGGVSTADLDAVAWS